jgi:hypothetical protein
MASKRETKRAVAERNFKAKNLRPRAVSANQARSVKGGNVIAGWNLKQNIKAS